MKWRNAAVWFARASRRDYVPVQYYTHFSQPSTNWFSNGGRTFASVCDTRSLTGPHPRAPWSSPERCRTRRPPKARAGRPGRRVASSSSSQRRPRLRRKSSPGWRTAADRPRTPRPCPDNSTSTRESPTPGETWFRVWMSACVVLIWWCDGRFANDRSGEARWPTRTRARDDDVPAVRPCGRRSFPFRSRARINVTRLLSARSRIAWIVNVRTATTRSFEVH